MSSHSGSQSSSSSSLESARLRGDLTRRPRVVNSCDHCRRKKARCTLQNGHSACDACLAAKLKCTFEDREHYQQERERRYAPLITPLISTGLLASDGQSGALLFDPVQPSHPHPALLPGLITAYYQYVHQTTPIVPHETVISWYLLSALPAALANAIAALAAPYASFIPELQGTDLSGAAQVYLNHTRQLICAEAGPVTTAHLQACVLAAREEMVAGHGSELPQYAQRAILLGMELGLGSDVAVVQLASADEERACPSNLRAIIFGWRRMLSQA